MMSSRSIRLIAVLMTCLCLPLRAEAIPGSHPLEAEDEPRPVVSSANVRPGRTVGGQAALERIRAMQRERAVRDEVRDERRMDATAAIIRITNDSFDQEIGHQVASLIEDELRRRGMFVKDYQAVTTILERRGFSGYRSSEALTRLGQFLETHLLLSVEVEEATVSTFAREFAGLADSGSLTLPGEEFVEIQIRLAAFDAGRSRLLFNRWDRQFLVYQAENDPWTRQEAFETAMVSCIMNLLRDLP